MCWGTADLQEIPSEVVVSLKMQEILYRGNFFVFWWFLLEIFLRNGKWPLKTSSTFDRVPWRNGGSENEGKFEVGENFIFSEDSYWTFDEKTENNPKSSQTRRASGADSSKNTEKSKIFPKELCDNVLRILWTISLVNRRMSKCLWTSRSWRCHNSSLP